MEFLPAKSIKAWTGTNRRLGQIRQIKDWGYKMGKDFWVRKDGSLAVKSDLLQSNVPVNAPFTPDFSCFAQKAQNLQAPAPTRIHPARQTPAKVS